MANLFARIKLFFENLESWAIKQPYLGILVLAARKSHKDHGIDMAASLAFFTFLSLFPLLLGLLSVGGYFLKSQDMSMRINQLIVELIPVSSALVTQVIDSLVHIRGATGITSVLILLWSAKKMVSALSRAINRALDLKAGIVPYLSPLRNFALTIAATGLIVVVIALFPVLELMASTNPVFLGQRWSLTLDIITSSASGFILSFFILAIVYGLIPHKRIGFRTLLPGIVIACLLLETGKGVFVWYVNTASDYDAVYGSLSSIVVLLIWLYFSAHAVIFGAEVISVNKIKASEQSNNA